MDHICSLVLIREFLVVSFLNELAKCQVLTAETVVTEWNERSP